jgi:hypothetical protein
MPTFNAIDLGAVAETRTTAAPPALQRVVYPGVRGVGVNYEGTRGMTTEATGLCYAPDLATLAATEQQFRVCQNLSTVADLTDTEGTTWHNVILVEYSPLGPIHQVVGGGWGREYRITFLHLTET